MKNTVLLILFSVLLNLHSFSQETDTNSVVFTLRGEIIKNCKILNIQPPNTLVFILNQDTLSAKAKAYVKDGAYFDLTRVTAFAKKNATTTKANDSLNQLIYKNYDYYFYQDQYHKAEKLQRAGIILVGAGSGAVVVGWALYYLGNQSASLEGFILVLPGVVLIGAGELAAIGGVVFTSVSIGLKSTNKKYMELCRPQQAISLQFGIQENGIGARIRF